ncbi:hypothetical protein P3S68_011733 [Capsicum galapagoense]
MQRRFIAWKARLHVIYSRYSNDKDRLSHRPKDVELDDWKHLVKYFGSDKFKVVSERNKRNREKQITKHCCGLRSFAEVEEYTRNPLIGEKDTPDKIWEIQHTRKNVNGERVWLDPQSEQIHEQLQQLVIEQQSEEIELRITGDEILSLANIEASVSSAVESIRQEMQLDMERKLQEEREQMAADLKRDMDQDLQKKLKEECEHMKGEVKKIFQEKMVALMAGIHRCNSTHSP